MRIFSCLILIALLLTTCESSTDYSSGPPIMLPPIISGYLVIGETGNIVKVVGKPNNHTSGKYIWMSDMVPNPSHSVFTIDFLVRKTERVRIWIVPGSSSGDMELNKIGLASVYRSGANEAILVFDTSIFAINPVVFKFIFDWNQIYNASNIGLFRLYVQAGDELLWTDGLHY